jgi:ATP-dependent RNA helicase DDX10/DBP4
LLAKCNLYRYALARLSLKDPEYLAVHAESASATPPKLQQMVATCELDKKMETMWAFIKVRGCAR